MTSQLYRNNLTGQLFAALAYSCAMAADRLDALEQAAWGGFLDTHDRLWRRMERGLVETGITMSEYDVLLALEEAGPRGVRMSDLATRRLMTTGGVTRLVNRLQRQQLVERRPSTTDGRSQEALLLPAGGRKLRRARRRHLQDVRDLFLAPLTTADLVHLRDVWDRINDQADGPGTC